MSTVKVKDRSNVIDKNVVLEFLYSKEYNLAKKMDADVKGEEAEHSA